MENKKPKISKRNIVIIIVAIVVVSSFLSSLFEDSDGDNSSSVSSSGASKVTYEDGVLAIVPDLRIGMTFSELPDKWVPDHEWRESGFTDGKVYAMLNEFTHPLKWPENSEHIYEFAGVRFKVFYNTRGIRAV